MKALFTLVCLFVTGFVSFAQTAATDLGLSVKWADRNLGASSPADPGAFYSWGETATKSTFSASTYDPLGDGTGGWDELGMHITGTSYDAATTALGSGWRIPTAAEIKELRDKCSWVWTTRNGQSGYLVTGQTGNSIFLPAAGYRFENTVYRAGEKGYYWSDTRNSQREFFAFYLIFDKTKRDVPCGYWDYGRNVRAVCE